MKIKIYVPFLLTFFSLFITSCATIVSGTSQVIKVQAIDSQTHEVIPYAKCTITNAKGVVFPVYGNPGSVNVPREYGGLQANCNATGYRQSGVGSGESFNVWTLVDVIFWPSLRPCRPARSTALMWTKTSLPPPSG